MNLRKHRFTKSQNNPDLPSLQDVLAEELTESTERVHLVDVREPDEFVGELGHIPGAKLLPLGQLGARAGELPPPGDTIVFVCRSGGRSGRAAAWALQNGFTDVYNLRGGMLRWNQLGYRTTTET